MTSPILEPSRLKEIKKTVAESWTPLQKQVRLETAQRLVATLRDATSDDDFYARAWSDFPVWCVAFIDDDSGKPLFPSKWQIDFAHGMDNFTYLWALCSRKCGKTTTLAAKTAHTLCGPRKRRIAGFAPTHGQDFVYRKTRKYLKQNPYLMDVFIKTGGNDTGEIISTSNGCELINRSISISTGGNTIRGEYGDTVYVDEIQSIDQSIMDTVIFPMIADMFSKKHLTLIGTPNLQYNPNLLNRWDAWGRAADTNPDYARMAVDWIRAVQEGCINHEYVETQRQGMTADDFAMEYEARFPDVSSRFYPAILLEQVCAKRLFYNDKRPKPNCQYIMSVDWAKYLNNTQILVGEYNLNTGELFYCDWLEINPGSGVIDYTEQTNIVKKMFWQYDCRWICPDSTSIQDSILEMLTYDDEDVNGIPRSAMYCENEEVDTDKKKYGFKATLSKNYEMHKDHKQMMVSGKVRVPSGGVREDEFRRKFFKEHHELQAVPAANSTFLKFVEPKNGSKDLVVAAAMMSIYLKLVDKQPAFMGLVEW